MEKSEKTVLRQYIWKASASYMERSANKCSCDDNLFPLGKIIVDFKKVEKAWINYKKWFFLCKILVFKLKKIYPLRQAKIVTIFLNKVTIFGNLVTLFG